MPAPALCLTLPAAAERLHIGRTSLFLAVARREIVTVRIGRYRLVRIGDLEDYAERLKAAQS